MNKIYTILFVLLAFCSCNPMDDIYDNLDAVKKPIAKQFDYELDVDTDYKTASDAALRAAKTKQDSTDAKSIATNKNFSAKVSAKKFMPYFLATKFPALKEKSTANVTYKFYDAAAKKTVDTTSQFVHNGEAWVLDQSVHYTFVKTDYQVVVDAVIAQGLNAYVHSKKNQDYYYGANAYYGQFDTKLTTRRANDKEGLLFTKDGKELSDDAAVKVIQEKIQEGIIMFLKSRYPDAQPKVDGVDMFYNITYSVRDNSNINNTVTYQCIAPGEFKLTAGPIEVQ